MSRNIIDLHPTMRLQCINWLAGCNKAALRVGISQTYRSAAEQDEAYAQGRTRPGKIITNARGGESPHNCVDAAGKPASKAFDFFIYANGNRLNWDPESPEWKRAIEIGEGLGLVSGSHFQFRDYAHLELPNWKERA